MKLKNKIIFGYFITVTIPLLLIGLIIIIYINKVLFNNILEFYQGQVFQVNNIINTLISDVMSDIENLSRNEVVITKNDRDFTNFLNADENTFKYNIRREEQKIIDIFYSYLITHPYINSVYMGRENGSFVRSHPRPKPTQYDPRERPWYKLAKENQDKVMRTEPYLSVTSDDVNIGIVKALIDKNKKFFGVVGADITLYRLANFISNIKLLKGDFIIVIDKDGKILVYPDKKMLFKSYEELKIKDKENFLKNQKGWTYLTENGRKDFLIYQKSKETGWQIALSVSDKIIIDHIKNTSFIILGGIIFITIFFIFISFTITNKLCSPVYKLISAMDEFVDKIKNRIAFKRIDIKTGDEIEKLAEAFNLMAHRLEEAYNKIDENYKRILELNRIKTSFTSLVSHEIRTPLTIIKGSVALLKDKKGYDKEKRNELIDIINRNITRLTQIIDDLIDISKIEKGIFPINKKQNNMITVTNKTIKEHLPFANNKNVKIIKNYKQKSLNWNFDRLKIATVLDNIINNSIKFSPENSNIYIDLKIIKGNELALPVYIKRQLTKENNYLLFSVKDEGQGIEKEYLEKVFDKFFQAEDPLTRKIKGMGVGLSIAKAIVEAHNGIIWCESEGKHKGTTFYVLLPE